MNVRRSVSAIQLRARTSQIRGNRYSLDAGSSVTQFSDPGESGQDGHLERWVDVVGTGNGEQDRAEQAWQIDRGLAYALDPVNSLCHVCPLAQRGGLSEPVRQVGQVGHRKP